MILHKAIIDDLPALSAIMDASIDNLLTPFLNGDQIAASREFMGIDSQLIKDGTYLKCIQNEEIVGCGGWSNRSTLFGGDHSKGRDNAFLDPAADAARVRAMYTHPDHIRKGIGRMVLKGCEDEARKVGFSKTLLVATLSGEKLYAREGYRPVKKITEIASNGVEVPFIHMEKSLT